MAGTPSVEIAARVARSEEHTSELQSRFDLVCRLLLEKKNRPMLRTLGCAYRQPDARRREQCERRESREVPPPSARGDRADHHPPRHRYHITRWVCTPA